MEGAREVRALRKKVAQRSSEQYQEDERAEGSLGLPQSARLSWAKAPVNMPMGSSMKKRMMGSA